MGVLGGGKAVLIGGFLAGVLVGASWWAGSASSGSDGVVLAAPAGALTAALDLALQDGAFTGALVGASVVDCATGDEIYTHDATRALNPASNMKLYTAAAALDALGPAYRFRTALLASGPVEDGVLKGDLYIVGGGDPELVFEEVWKIAQELKARGLRRIDGDLVADDTFFDGERGIPGWGSDRDDTDRAYNAQLGALSFSFNTVALVIRPGPSVGSPGLVGVETPSSFVTIDNQVKTVSAGKVQTLDVDAFPAGEGVKLVVRGNVALDGSPKAFYRAVPDPPRFALAQLADRLAEVGIAVGGGRRLGKAPESANPLHEWYSSSLDIVLRYMNKISSNFIAEQLLKTMAAEVRGAPGTSAVGVELVRAYLSANGLLGSDFSMYNGSGLSSGGRTTARDLTRLLAHVQRDPRIRWEYLASLPIAGVDGTLRTRMRNGPAEGIVRAKTGSINNVYAMSGYVARPDGGLWAFSLIANALSKPQSTVKRAMDIFVETLARPAPEGAAPGPG